MRRATNNKRGQWVEITYKTKKGEALPPLVAYVLKNGDRRIIVAFKKEDGGLFNTYQPVKKITPVKPPKWAANMWDISDEADRVGHYANLYDARYKTIISDSYEGSINREIRDYQRYINLFQKLKIKEPWR